MWESGLCMFLGIDVCNQRHLNKIKIVVAYYHKWKSTYASIDVKMIANHTWGVPLECNDGIFIYFWGLCWAPSYNAGNWFLASAHQMESQMTWTSFMYRNMTAFSKKNTPFRVIASIHCSVVESCFLLIHYDHCDKGDWRIGVRRFSFLLVVGPSMDTHPWLMYHRDSKTECSDVHEAFEVKLLVYGLLG